MASSLRAHCAAVSFELSSCCFCVSLRAAVFVFSWVHLINACLAFAGEAALFFGLGTITLDQSAGVYLPPGTKATDPKIQGFLIFLGLYYLVSAVAGLDSVVRRNLCSASIMYCQVRVAP